MEVGVLAIQGDFAEHIATLESLGVEAREIRLPHQLETIGGLIIPGGESTTLSRLMTLYDLRDPIAAMAAQGKALWGTCAGMIMMAQEITEEDPVPLGIMDIGVHRNAYGRQVDSFELDLPITGFAGPDSSQVSFHCVFIRAPMINRLGDGVNVLASLPDGEPVAVQQGKVMATSFHPELTNDTRFHAHFLDLVPVAAE
ncbi:MAG TPA: pyridoxal 5'-phosphate synthase glutaminase subunit PdxT [Dehalococcoidia bacterium]|nr:pyridoxal 5'-phosphate synthase glutaminase subunit PdxT [Dehalococcoidia bacterium]